MGFSVILQTVLIMLFYALLGFVLVKARLATSSHAKTLSALLVYICCPAMIVSAFQNMTYTPADFGKIAAFFLVSLALQLLFFVLLYFLLRRRYADAKYRILTIGAILGNVGFFGLPLVTALFPENPLVACYSSVNTMSMNLLIFTVGIFMITQNRRFVSPKAALLNPTTLAVLGALPLYFLNWHFPTALGNAVALLGNMSTPVCMFILGMRLAAVSLPQLFRRPFAYGACLLKLVVFPLFSYLCVSLLPVDTVFQTCILVLAATPSGAIILSQAELHDCEQELTANVVLLTTLLSVVSLPLILQIL